MHLLQEEDGPTELPPLLIDSIMDVDVFEDDNDMDNNNGPLDLRDTLQDRRNVYLKGTRLRAIMTTSEQATHLLRVTAMDGAHSKTQAL